ncbi:MAG: hypothetical protein COB77_06020 [Gammaproteobacteria bacterium]|nr:MAG: hypothetical protein COB77_06020 [Gammaproteobacteria bacterium]
MNISTANHKTINSNAAEATTLSILVNGDPVCLEYEELISFHQGDSWFGCAVGYRAMQLAARELSGNTLWSRESLSIISGHPGAGVKDAIELVSGVISSDCFQLLDSIAAQGCNRFMKFEWWLSDTRRTLHIKLRDNIVPETFFLLLDRLSNDEKLTDAERENERRQFDQMKSDLSDNVWNQSLDDNFDFDFLEKPLKAGEMPNA